MPDEAQAACEPCQPSPLQADRWEERARELGLSARQVELAALVCQGHTGRQIAARMGTSPADVRADLRALCQQLKVRNRVGVVSRLILGDRHASIGCGDSG